jgi:aldehyde:ferredoxin oxidoreductase
MHVKGLEIPAYDPRGAPGMGLGYATSPRGACHGRASDYSLRPYYKIDRLAIEGKGIMIKQAQDARCIFDCAVMCMFLHGAAFAGSLEETAALLSAATGFNFNVEELLKTGERINNLERCFNVREGFTRADDTLPKRFMEEPLPEGPSKGLVLSAEMLNQMLDEYYQSRGWDKKTGIPTRAKLEELELEFVADELEKLKKLPT